MSLRNYRCIQYWFAILWISIRIEAFTIPIGTTELADVNDNRYVESRLSATYLAKRDLNNKHNVSEPIKKYKTTEGEHNGINNVTNDSIDINNIGNATKEDTLDKNVESTLPNLPSEQVTTTKIGITEFVNMYQFMDTTKQLSNQNTTDTQDDKSKENILTELVENTNRLPKSMLTTVDNDYLVNNSTDQVNSGGIDTPPKPSAITTDTDNPQDNTADQNNHEGDSSKSVSSSTTPSNIDPKNDTEAFLKNQKRNYEVLGFLTDYKSKKNIEKVDNKDEIKEKPNRLQDVHSSVLFSNNDLLDVTLAGDNNQTDTTVLKSSEKIQIDLKPFEAKEGKFENINPTTQTDTSNSITYKTEASDVTLGSKSSITLSTTSYDQDLSSKPDQSVRSLLLTVAQQEPITHPDVPDPVGVLSTKRGGYLDISVGLFPPNTAPTVSVPETSNTTEGVTKSTPFQPKLHLSSADDSTSHDTDVPVSKMDAIKHLFDDAIKEDELLMEKTISNNNDMVKIASWAASSSPNVGTDIGEPSMSVMPIAKVYTVNPNYKPLKKLEISSPKPVFKHPDDNSWRNESISSLGIVFKPTTNSSKPLTQVLKTKSEMAVNETATEKQSKDIPDLRERLEKLTEKRKSKKKKPGIEEGELDYEEVPPMLLVTTPTAATPIHNTERVSTPLTTQAVYINTETYEPDLQKIKENKQKVFSAIDYEDDYSTVQQSNGVSSTSPSPNRKYVTTSINSAPKTETTLPNTYPTMFQTYFSSLLPPAYTEYMPKLLPKDSTSDINFDRKINQFTLSEETTSSAPKLTITTTDYKHTTSAMKTKPLITFKPIVENENGAHGPNYMIRHLKDLMDHAARDNFERALDFVQSLSESPVQGRQKPKTSTEKYDDYEYGPVYKNVNMNTYYKPIPKSVADIPVIYNNSVIHTAGDRLAMSNAFVKQYYNYESSVTKQPAHYLQQTKRYDPTCENMTVELSPAYELHYYVPDQEEKEELDRTSGGFYSNFQIARRWM